MAAGLIAGAGITWWLWRYEAGAAVGLRIFLCVAVLLFGCVYSHVVTQKVRRLTDER